MGLRTKRGLRLRGAIFGIPSFAMRHALLLAIVLACLSVGSRAACAGSLVDQFTPVMGESLSLHDVQIPTGSLYELHHVPYCQAAFTPDANGMHQSCCDSTTFERLHSFAEAVAMHIGHVGENLNALREYNSDDLHAPAAYSTALATLQGEYNTFADNFFPHYSTCAEKFHDYIAGVLCLLCRTDFFPTIVNDTGDGLVWHFKPETCSDLATACGPALLDVRTFVLAYAQFAHDVASIAAPGATTAPPSDFDILADVSGATLDDKVRTWICDLHARGFEDIDPMNSEEIHMEIGAALEDAHLPTQEPMHVAGKRSNQLRDGVKRALHLQQARQSISASTNVYSSTAVANPVVTGAQVTLLPNTAVSSASLVSLLALVGVFVLHFGL